MELMPRQTRFCVLLLTLIATVSILGCGSSPTTPTTPTAPTVITDTFSETLTINGGRTHLFSNSQTGSISATLTTVGPDSTTVVGLAIGTWNGLATDATSGSCQIIIAKDNAVQGNSVIGNASVGNFCARVFDVGKLTGPVDYTITVSHF